MWIKIKIIGTVSILLITAIISISVAGMKTSRNNICENISTSNDGRIWGHVNGIDNLMSGALVICKGKGNSYFNTTIASEEHNGIFEFKNAPVPGVYTVIVTRMGYKYENKTVELTSSYKSIHLYFLLDKSKTRNPLFSNIFEGPQLLKRILNMILNIK